MTEALDNAEAALSAARVAQWNRVMPEPVTLMNALEALASEHRRLLAELDEAHAHFQVQEARIREARQVDDVTDRQAVQGDAKLSGNSDHRAEAPSDAVQALIDASDALTAAEVHDHPFAALDKVRALTRELRAALTPDGQEKN